MRLAVYDFLGALLAQPVPVGSRHTDKLFERVCGIMKGRFADPDISPREVAAETGISLSDIAYACGFRDCTYFARRFRHRFGTTPGAVGAGVTGRRATREQCSLNSPWSWFLAESPLG